MIIHKSIAAQFLCIRIIISQDLSSRCSSVTVGHFPGLIKAGYGLKEGRREEGGMRITGKQLHAHKIIKSHMHTHIKTQK